MPTDCRDVFGVDYAVFVGDDTHHNAMALRELAIQQIARLEVQCVDDDFVARFEVECPGHDVFAGAGRLDQPDFAGLCTDEFGKRRPHPVLPLSKPDQPHRRRIRPRFIHALVHEGYSCVASGMTQRRYRRTVQVVPALGDGELRA